ncbi:hypothetical protein M5X06_08560 [Paenibacillus alvei]|uniref:Uncharacterized protein n=1 Tax=Paenibacillus alvei TaxID=44250 RepID=A0ABT4H6L8_PAEAL|nr:hypothetical protein [Paenibacillus alvei]MCY9764398.1 hypothetical protein [Paenibacillus alvei]MCY9766884.1 hypothetical protein [Paenibacillus alvei]
MPSQVLDWISNKTFFSIIIFLSTISAIYTIITNHTKIVKLFLKLLRKKELPKYLDVLERESNPRFGFSYLFPKHWDRVDPVNGDGNTYIHPENNKIKILVWGSYAVVWTELEELIKNTVNIESENKKFELYKKISSGKYVRTENSRAQIEGVRIEFSYYDEENEKINFIQAFTQYKESQFCIRCQVPNKYYKTFYNDFLNISSSLYVIEKE